MYRNSARRRGYEFSLTDTEVFALFSGDCYYCGAPPSQERRQRGDNGYFLYNGIDRVDNARGYVTDNCVSCCKYCNHAKTNRSAGEFIAWAKTVASKAA